MKNKTNYNNLFDSICLTLLFALGIISYLIIIWFGVVNYSEGTNPTATLLVSTFLFVPMIVITVVFLILHCYEYWILTDDFILSKKVFKKKTIIFLKEIIKVEKKTVPALIIGLYKSEAYIIYSSDKKIVILINKNKEITYTDLNYELNKFIV